MSRFLGLGALLLVLSLATAGAQATTSSSTSTATTSTTTSTTAPTPAASPALGTAEPYRDSEFAPWMLKLRRAEIVAGGAFPLVFLFSGLGYDLYYYTAHGFPSDNIPWPAGPGTSRWTAANNPDALQQKNLTLVLSSVVISLAVAGADWWLGQ